MTEKNQSDIYYTILYYGIVFLLSVILVAGNAAILYHSGERAPPERVPTNTEHGHITKHCGIGCDDRKQQLGEASRFLFNKNNLNLQILESLKDKELSSDIEDSITTLLSSTSSKSLHFQIGGSTQTLDSLISILNIIRSILDISGKLEVVSDFLINYNDDIAFIEVSAGQYIDILNHFKQKFLIEFPVWTKKFSLFINKSNLVENTLQKDSKLRSIHNTLIIHHKRVLNELKDTLQTNSIRDNKPKDFKITEKEEGYFKELFLKYRTENKLVAAYFASTLNLMMLWFWDGKETKYLKSNDFIKSLVKSIKDKHDEIEYKKICECLNTEMDKLIGMIEESNNSFSNKRKEENIKNSDIISKAQFELINGVFKKYFYFIFGGEENN